ncbi:MAG: hypothetical protein E6G05_01795 [Actinobacteria bacterium]|nr:MAG: hypothetical protein E6G05_01795 [Actinomycetota bacterium]
MRATLKGVVMSFQQMRGDGSLAARMRCRSVGLLATAVTVSAIWGAGLAQPAAAQSGIISAQVQALQAALIGVGPGTAMFDQAGAVRNDLVGDNTAQACDDLQGLINHTKAQAGKQLTSTLASDVIESATGIKTELGCGSS